MEQEHQLDPTAVLVDDLTRRVAAAQLEAAQWRTRAVVAEQALAEMRAAEQENEAEDGDE